MVLEAINLEISCKQEIKNTVTSTIYPSKDDLCASIKTSLEGQGFTVDASTVKQYYNQLTPLDPSVFFFPPDTSLLYIFKKDIATDMVYQFPALSAYVKANDIDVIEENNVVKFYLAYTLPMHDYIFGLFKHIKHTRDSLITIPSNPLLWKHPECPERCVLEKNSLYTLYDNNPDSAPDISQYTILKGWRNYIFLYLTKDFKPEDKPLLEAVGAEFETKPS